MINKELLNTPPPISTHGLIYKPLPPNSQKHTREEIAQTGNRQTSRGRRKPLEFVDIKTKSIKMKLLDYFVFGVVSILITVARCEVTEIFAEEGSQVVLPCKYSNFPTSPPAIVWNQVNKGTVWRKERSGLEYWGVGWSQKGQRVRCPHDQFDRGDFSLEINNVKEENGGLYSCRVEAGNQNSVKSVMLRIIKVSVSPATPISGEDVSVNCNLTPWREGVSVKWMLNNSPYVPRSHPWSKFNRDKLKSLKASEKLSGNWTCVLGYKNVEVRASATLSVQGIVQPSNDDAKVYAALGSTFTLPCVFTSSLIPSNPVLEKLNAVSLTAPNVNLLSLSPSSIPSRLHWDQSVRFSEVALDDKGKYRCAGTVKGRRLTRTMQLVIAQIVLSKKSRSVTLTCQLNDASEVTEYEWIHVTYDQNGTESFGPIQKGKTITISNGLDENWGEWRCSFYGKEGLLGNVTYNAPLMSGLSGGKSSGHSSNTATVVGLSFLLLILLLVLAQMYKNHQRRKRIFQYPALETIVHTVSNEREQRERSHAKN